VNLKYTLSVLVHKQKMKNFFMFESFNIKIQLKAGLAGFWAETQGRDGCRQQLWIGRQP